MTILENEETLDAAKRILASDNFRDFNAASQIFIRSICEPGFDRRLSEKQKRWVESLSAKLWQWR